MNAKNARKRENSLSILPGFTPLDALWAGNRPAYPSEQSARWAVRTHRRALTDAGALALLRGRIFVHPERFSQVMEAEAIGAMRRREAGHGG